MEETLKILQKETEELKNSIELIEQLTGQDKSGKGLLLEHLIKKFVNVKVKMYQEHHNLPHVHIDIGKDNHSASIAIENQAILAGSIEKKYEKIVLSWIEKNKANLLIVWNSIQEGQLIDLSNLN
ncbi:DUF4160 domain-containing protein [Flavobacterium sp. F-328]|uniref:DUF4160 domain-containing protein n=1 Tax=Flavobacterium erciyesense TaxID=2825842 RepID=A0ABS5D7N6_9FLAO|nr:DUF4160 domain-containing protein [Flavobacterium erciyesense]MBQ0910046.1 DUF4160 domain-containing protein [Flavobacterium erciyesense]